jgi:hypothetical protein
MSHSPYIRGAGPAGPPGRRRPGAQRAMPALSRQAAGPDPRHRGGNLPTSPLPAAHHGPARRRALTPRPDCPIWPAAPRTAGTRSSRTTHDASRYSSRYQPRSSRPRQMTESDGSCPTGVAQIAECLRLVSACRTGEHRTARRGTEDYARLAAVPEMPAVNPWQERRERHRPGSRVQCGHIGTNEIAAKAPVSVYLARASDWERPACPSSWVPPPFAGVPAAWASGQHDHRVTATSRVPGCHAKQQRTRVSD